MPMPLVTNLRYLKSQRQLHIEFQQGQQYQLSCEYLRVYSPSAEVQNHGKPKLVTNKKNVAISSMQPVGHYAVKITFDDGHDTGLYSWAYLAELGENYADYWQAYLARLDAEKGSREPLIAMNIRYADD